MDQDCKKLVKRWENMDSDILLKIFQNHFNIDELTSGLAHVCSGWRAVCCDPVLWDTVNLIPHKSIPFKDNVNYVFVELRSDEDLTRMLKVSMNLSKGNIKTLIVHHKLFLTDEMVTYTAKRCPNLRRLVLPSWDRIMTRSSTICDALNSWKKLESLTMPSLINSHLFFSLLVKRRKYRELKVMGPIDIFFAESIVAYLPKLKVLSLRCTIIDQDALNKILDKLKCLEVLNICHSHIMVEQQQQYEVILKKASKLKQFLTCTENTCLICQMVWNDQGLMRWSMYENGLWKADEVSSLHL
ncbi:F-box/LRR-repeat protein [Cardamine amara subsp. amara]|uniref:F-box/LRR-repeat protein n=1 Tax=Cardamine amara subsp. amara TaxID=228776 RepID=A0ABD1C9P5_CARAN